MPSEDTVVDTLQKLQEFKELLSQEGSTCRHLPDDILVRVLISRNYNLEEAKVTLAKYTNAKKAHPELFVSPDNHDRDILQRVGSALPSTVRTVDGGRCMITIGVEWDPDAYNLEQFVQALIFSLEACDLDHGFHRDGYVHFVDAANLSWKHVKAIRPGIVMAAASFLTYEAPINLKQIVVFNANWMVDVIWKIVKPLLPNELVQLITIINVKNPDKLTRFLPKETIESKSFIPTEESINDHVTFLTGNREKLSNLWNVVFNEEVI